MTLSKDSWGVTARRAAVSCVAIGLATFQLVTAFCGSLSPMIQRFVHLFGALLLTFLLYGTRGKQGKRPTTISWWDPALVGVTACIGVYLLIQFNPNAVLNRGIWGISTVEKWVGLLLIVLVLEAARRVLGWPLVIVALVALGYALLGPYLPMVIAHKGYDVWRIVETISWTTEGILGVPMAASATFVAVFIMFGAFLETLGGAKFFLDLSSALAGHRKGGPAQVAVLSSAAMGTISGSAVANVVTTGTFTIPLMKSLGYQPAFAGAVEAVASTGGQIMPPIMGAAAFVMAEMIEVPYWKICVAAALPAVLYYLSASAQVYLRADRLGLRGLPREQLPKLWPTLRQGWYLLVPVISLLVMLIGLQYSPMKAGIWTLAIMVTLICVNYVRHYHRFPWRELVDALESGGKTMVPVATACGAAGIVIGIVSLTGIGVRFSQLVIDLAHGSLPLTLVYTMLACIVLGMGLPTTAAYIITAVLGAPALVKLGVDPLAAHLFVLYFACLSFITPPVALAAYAAAGLADANPMQTGWSAWKLGLAGFIVPFMFIYNKALLLSGQWYELILAGATSILGVFALAVAVEGWLRKAIQLWQRLVAFASSILLIVPGLTTDLAGILLFAVVCLSVRLGQGSGHRQGLASANIVR
ncbi:MAG: TRAP transporter permease [Firmicutes bacterium]|nr:TRAP transporter permease [Bacillota bacterium]